MKTTIALAAVLLTGCAGMEPMTPEQAAVFIQMQQAQQANNMMLMQNMQSNPVFQRQQVPAPAYVVPRPAYQEPTRMAPTNCTTNMLGGSAFTTCY